MEALGPIAKDEATGMERVEARVAWWFRAFDALWFYMI
jgi:hypothetical protein